LQVNFIFIFIFFFLFSFYHKISTNLPDEVFEEGEHPKTKVKKRSKSSRVC